jgi:TolB-like protein
MTLVSSDPGQWAELFATFDTLAELDTGARAERLDAIGSTNPEARRVLEELLDADANLSSLREIDAIFGQAPPLPLPEHSGPRDVLKLAGRTVAHFRVVEPLGAGGMGVVYRAIDLNLGRAVALKFSLPEQQLDRLARDRLLREARAAAALDHPNICSIYETGETADGQVFFAMPLYEGATLKARITREGGLPLADALAIVAQIARGLQAAHRTGIVHRDLKPANVITLPDGGVKILDFGVAWMRDVTSTASHAARGTVSYMAPEQVRGEHVDGRADIWALGVVLYEMLTGRRPFDGAHEFAIAYAIVQSNPVPPSTLRPDVSAALDAFVLGLLAKDPSGRAQSAEAVVADVSALASGTARANTRRSRRVLTRSARRVLVATVAAIAVALAVTSWRLRSRAASASDLPRLVAVLPFEGGSTTGDASYLGPALAAEIASRLSRLSALGVTGESLSVKYRGSSKAPQDIARELGVDAVITGAVRRVGDDVRLEVTLFDAGEQQRVWTREYGGPVNRMLALQRNATEGIIGALGVNLTPAERSEVAHLPTESVEAYDLYLRGQAAQIAAASLDSESERMQSLRRAQSYFARARETDLRFAAPRAGLARSHLAFAPYDSSSARRDQAKLEAEAALRLEPGMSEAHEALASYWLLRGDRARGVSELELALAGRPNASPPRRKPEPHGSPRGGGQRIRAGHPARAAQPAAAPLGRFDAGPVAPVPRVDRALG